MSRIVQYAKRQRAAWLLGDFWRFATVTNILDKLDPQPHDEMMREMFECIPDFKSKRQKRKLYLAPRYSYKSTIAVALCAYLILRYPNIKIAIYRANRKLSIQMLGTIKAILTTNQEILATFGDLSKEATDWTTMSITVNTRTRPDTDPTVAVHGIKASAAGSHPDFILADDLVTETNCDSIVEMDKAEELVASFYGVLPPWGSVCITGTQWSNIDVYTRIRTINKELVEAGKERDYSEYIRTVEVLDPVTGGVSLFFPRELHWEFLERQRASIPARWYASWYYQETGELGMKVFPRDKLRFFDGIFTRSPFHTLEIGELSLEPIPVYVVLVVDPALTDGVTSDNFGVVIIGFDEHGRWFVLFADSWRKLPSDAGEELIKLLIRFEPDTLLIESQNADAEMVARLGAFIRESSMRCSVKSYSALQDEVAGKRGKAQRILSLEPIAKQGRLFLRRGACAPLVRQLDNYPSIKLDDCIDALAMGRKLANMGQSVSKALKNDEGWEPVDQFHERLDELERRPVAATRSLPNGMWTGPFGQGLRSK
jgi:hypothetical protein